MVLLTALIRVLYAEFNVPVDIVTSGPWSEPLLHGQPGVGEIFSMRSRKTPYWLNPDQREKLPLAARRTRHRAMAAPGPDHAPRSRRKPKHRHRVGGAGLLFAG